MEENITLILADGTIIDNLTLSGNNLISQADVGEDKLSAVNLSHITINGVEYRDMLLRNYWKDKDGWHIVLSEVTPQEQFEARINSKIDYIAMMEDIEV
jgi:hypothetical protein